MSGTIVMAVEGVLVGRDDDVELTRDPLEATGAMLYASLMAVSTRLVLASNLERSLLAHWCRAQGLRGHSGLIALDENAVTRLRSGGEHVSLYVDHDGERTAAALRAGVPTLLYARPLYARASHRPDLPQLRRPWAELIAEQQAQREARKRPLVAVDDD